VGLERGPLSLVSTTEELLDRKVAAPVYKIENTAVGIRHAYHVASSIRKSWQSTSPTSGGRSVGVVRSRTQTMEFSFRRPGVYTRSICSRYSDWLRAGRQRGRSSSPGKGKNFYFSTMFRPALGPTQLPIQWVPGAKWPGRQSDYSPPNSAVVKTWIYTSTLPYVLME
jgi:hypothetical protein